MATAGNGELLRLSGPRNPYPGTLGVVEEGALADLVVVDGDPLADLKLIEDPGKNFVVIDEGRQDLQEHPPFIAQVTRPIRPTRGAGVRQGGHRVHARRSG